MLFNEENTALTVKAAPNVPQEVIDRLNGLVPSEFAGSCGTAVFKNNPQYVCDTYTDNRWKNYTQYAKDFTIRACWSMPIRNAEGEAFGSFALTSFETRTPTDFNKHLIATGAILASIVLKRHAEREHLEYAAHHDNLTGLPNRCLLSLRLEHAIDQAKRNGKQLALLFMDLDNFKVINDTQGHDIGDQVLKAVSDSLNTCSRSSDTLARIGGDEFVLLVEELDHNNDIQIIAEKFLKALASPILVQGNEYTITASMGISIFPDDGETPEALLQNADTAMYAAKSSGRNKFTCYKPQLTNLIQERVELESELREAIKNNDLIVYYQPIYSTQQGKLKTVEALVRWQHPVKGLILPDAFISLAEETGLIKDLGYLVTKMSCQQCVAWWKSGLPKFKLAVNISVNELNNEYMETLITLLDEIEFPISQLELEVTETLIMLPDGVAVTELKKMRDSGISISLDDFGTGQSSLAHLKNIPIGKLKIDRSFIMNIPKDQDDMVIAKTIIVMGHSLGLTVVAEGVETREQKKFLEKEHCDLLQGYYLSHPLPIKEFESLLNKLPR